MQASRAHAQRFIFQPVLSTGKGDALGGGHPEEREVLPEPDFYRMVSVGKKKAVNVHLANAFNVHVRGCATQEVCPLMFTVASRRTDDDARRMTLFACQCQGFGQIMGVLLLSFMDLTPEADKSFEHIPVHAVHIADHTIGDNPVVKAGGQGSVTRKDVRFLGEVVSNHLHAAPFPRREDEAGLRAHAPDTGLAFLNPTVGGNEQVDPLWGSVRAEQ